MSPVFILLFLSGLVVFAVIVPLLEKRHLEYKKDLCRKLVEVVISDLDSRLEDIRLGSMTKKQAMKRAIQRLRRFRFGGERKDYYWITGPGPRILMHPYRPDLENMDLKKINWVDGENLKMLFTRMDIAAGNPDGGFVYYKWHLRDNLAVFEDKLSYVKLFRPWGWVVGTGVYITDVREELAEWKKTFMEVGLVLTGISCLVAFVLSLRSTQFEKTRNEAIEKLKANEDKFRTIFDYSPFGIAINRLSNGQFVAANPALRLMLGFNEKRILSYSWKDMGFEIMDIDEIFSELVQIGNIINREVKIKITNGETRTVLYSGAIILYEENKAILSMLADITQERQMEETLFQTQKLDVIGQLAGGIAHDFNNMLSGIMGGAEMLKLKLGDESPYMQNVDLILNGTRRASDLTYKLLTFSRKREIIKIRVDIHEIIRDAVILLERSIDRRISIQLYLNASNPYVAGDATLLQNVFLNLGLNSRDAMTDGGILAIATANIILDESFCVKQVGHIVPGSFIEIDISDTGCGMDQEIMARIFEPFFTTKSPGTGTGLGMSVLYGTVKEHRGAVNIFSEPGTGTVVKVYLPVDSVFQERLAPDDSLVYGSGRILYIDDEEIVRLAASALLESLGYEVETAEDGEKGIELFRQVEKKFDLVILDMIMPKLNGIDTFNMLKEIDPDVKVIFTSGYSREWKIKSQIEKGAAGFIQKPFQFKTLSRIVADAFIK